MSDVDVHIPTEGEPANAPIPFAPPKRRWRRGPRAPKPKLRKLRLLLILTGLGALALVSTFFGMMMAVASDLPQIENVALYKYAANSYLFDDQGRPIGIFAPPGHQVIDTFQQISPSMRHAIVSVEDKRFWSESGVDIRGIARAFIADLGGGSRQGASTIAQQFVKNALAESNNRTILEKLREAALAYHLTREWKKGKILREYLNTIYFGNGAYGIESAARVYFGKAHGYDASASIDEQSANACGDSRPGHPHPTCASDLNPWESALLAGMVANPAAFNPLVHRTAATDRRNLVLRDMLDQHYISRQMYDISIHKPVPTEADIQQPAEPPAAPYFTSWLHPQVIAALEHEGVPARVAEYRAYYGGLKIHTTIDLQMQEAAQTAINDEFGSDPNGPTAALVAIDNHTGQVRAMVSGNGDYNQSQFNLATQSHRQAGSSFKVFTLAAALKYGTYGPYSVIDSAPQDFIVPNSAGKEHFIVHNFGNTYSGPISLQEATAISDNTVFSQVGIHTGVRRIARLAQQMGIRTHVSHNYAMILGAPKIGPSVLDMAHAYETLATGGLKVYNPILGDLQAGSKHPGPTGIAEIQCPVCSQKTVTDQSTRRTTRILSPTVAATEQSMLEGVVAPGGTGNLAAIPGVVVAGKTGTTSNYVDAWFVGWTPQITTAVWVGYPKSDIPMSTLYNGAPVEGGTFPAIIWHNFMEQALQIMADEAASHHSHTTTPGTTDTSASPTNTGTNPTGTATSAAPPTQTTDTTGAGTPATGGTNNTGTPGAGGGTPATGAPPPTDTTGGGGGPTQAPAGGGSSGGTGTTGGAGIGGG